MKKIIQILAIIVVASSSVFSNPIFWSPTTSSNLNPNFTITVSSDGATSYTIEVWSDPTYSTAPVRSQTSALRNFYVSGLTYGATYYLRTTSNASTPGYYGYKTITITSTVPETIPTIANGTVMTANAWFYTSTVGAATLYEFQFDTSPAFNTVNLVNGSSTTHGIFYPTPPFLSSTVYYIRARATDGGLTGPWTSPANVKNFTTSIGTASFASPTSGSVMNRSGFKLWINKVNGATGYDIQISTNSSFSPALYTISPPDANINPSYYVYDYAGKPGQSALNLNTLYYFRVRSKNGSQTGAYSSYITINTGTPAVNLTNVVNGTTYAPTYVIKAALTSGATSYNLQLSTTSNFSAIVYNVTQTGTNFDVSGVTNRGVALYARARVNGLSFKGTVYNFVLNGTPTATISSPSSGSAINYGTYFYTASNYPTSELTYYYEADLVNTFNSGGLIQVSTTNPQGGVALVLVRNNTYYVRVRVKITASGLYSAWSPIITVTTNTTPRMASSPFATGSSVADPLSQPTFVVAFGPNPFADYIQVSGNSGVGISSVSAFDMAGQAIELKATADGFVNTSALSKGVYMLQVAFDDGTVSKVKVVKE